MTPLRHRMLEDVQIRNLSAHSNGHIARTSPDSRGTSTGRRRRTGPGGDPHLQLYLIRDRKLAPVRSRSQMCALRVFYKITLKQLWSFDDLIPTPKKPRRLPIVLSPDDVVAGQHPHPKHRPVLTTCSAAGLRASEAVHLRPTDVDSRRIVLCIGEAKGNATGT